MIRNCVLLLILGMTVGYVSHNVYSCFKYKNSMEPAVKVIKKDLYEIVSLPYRAGEKTDYDLLPFPLPDFSQPSEPERKQERVNVGNDSMSDLEMRLSQAVRDSEATYTPDDNNIEEGIYTINDLSYDMKLQIPDFAYDSHVYSSNDKDKFITLNKKNYHEGDIALGVMKVVKIQPNYTVFRMKGTTFSVQSLTDWKSK